MATRLQSSTAPAVSVESDSENNDVNGRYSTASVHLYMAVEQDSVDSAGDGEPIRNSNSSRVDGASYVQLQYIPEQTHSHRWHVFTDSSENSGTDEPLVDFGHVFVPAQSSGFEDSADRPSSHLASTSIDRHLCLERVEPGASCSQTMPTLGK